MVQLACYGYEMKRLYVFVLAVITLLVLSASCGDPNGDERLLLPEPSSIPHLHMESKTNLSGRYRLEKDCYRMIGGDSLQPEACQGLSASGFAVLAVLLAFFTCLLWYVRLQMKLYLTEQHLALDAQERCAFAQS